MQNLTQMLMQQWGGADVRHVFDKRTKRLASLAIIVMPFLLGNAANGCTAKDSSNNNPTVEISEVETDDNTVAEISEEATDDNGANLPSPTVLEPNIPNSTDSAFMTNNQGVPQYVKLWAPRHEDTNGSVTYVKYAGDYDFYGNLIFSNDPVGFSSQKKMLYPEYNEIEYDYDMRFISKDGETPFYLIGNVTSDASDEIADDISIEGYPCDENENLWVVFKKGITNELDSDHTVPEVLFIKVTIDSNNGNVTSVSQNTGYEVCMLDSDNDGVLDKYDLDDDNDGVLDFGLDGTPDTDDDDWDPTNPCANKDTNNNGVADALSSEEHESINELHGDDILGTGSPIVDYCVSIGQQYDDDGIGTG